MSRHISILLTSPKKNKPFAEGIKLVEGTDFSHIAVTWKNTRIDRRKVFEAVGAGTRNLKNTTFKKINNIKRIYRFEVPEEIGQESLEIVLEQYSIDVVGTSYGFKHIVGLLLMRVGNFLAKAIGSKKKFHNPYKDGKYSQICVEAAAYVLSLIKIKTPKEIEDYGLVEFEDWLKAVGGVRLEQERVDSINK